MRRENKLFQPRRINFIFIICSNRFVESRKIYKMFLFEEKKGSIEDSNFYKYVSNRDGGKIQPRVVTIFPSNLFKKGYTLTSRRFYSFLPSDDYSSFFLFLFSSFFQVSRSTFTYLYLCVSLIRLKNFHFAGEKDLKKERKEEKKEKEKGSKSDSPIRWIFFILFSSFFSPI